MIASRRSSHLPHPTDPQWQALANRDRLYDGRYFYAVVTTGIYCRPSCTARLPKRENVRFCTTVQAASDAGYRACNRCRPTSSRFSSGSRR